MTDPVQMGISSAMQVAKDLATGHLTPDQLDAVVVEELRTAFGYVAGPDDPLWLVHCDIARQVLAHNGMPANELAEWLAVIRASEAGPRQPSWIETVLAQLDDEDEAV